MANTLVTCSVPLNGFMTNTQCGPGSGSSRTLTPSSGGICASAPEPHQADRPIRIARMNTARFAISVTPLQVQVSLPSQTSGSPFDSLEVVLELHIQKALALEHAASERV